MRRARIWTTVSLLVCTVCANVFANGYRMLGVKSGRANGMGEAFAVTADDPSAIAINPAGIAQLEGHQINVHATACNGYFERTDAAGVTTKNLDKWQVVPSFFVTSDIGRDDFVVGLGVSLPNGLSGEWANDSFARYVTTYSSLTVVDINPAIAMRITDRLMVGGGINYYYSEARLESMVDAGLAAGSPGAMDLESVLDGDGATWGFNLGAIYRINDRHSVAAAYRHPYSIEYDGSLAVAGTRADISATVDFPMTVVLGYSCVPADKWRVEVNVDCTLWDKVGDIEVSFDAPGVAGIAQTQDMKNTVALKLGAEYEHSDAVTLRCGYIYNQNATAESTWRPSIIDSDVHFLTAGMSYEMESLTVDLAFQFLLTEERTIDNNVDMNETMSSSTVDGTYDGYSPCGSVSATYRF